MSAQVKLKSLSLISVTQSQLVVTQKPLESGRPFIHRQIYSSFLENCLRKNPSSKTLDNILEKEVKYLVEEFYSARRPR